MRSWKLVLAGLLLAYLVLGSAISLLMERFASASLAQIGGRQHSYSQDTRVTAPECRIAEQGAIALTALPSPRAPSIGPGKNAWDFSGPDEVPGQGPWPCDNYAEFMTWALGQ